MAREKVSAIRKKVSATWEEALQEFLFWKESQGLAERTITDYRKHVTQFFKRYPNAYDCFLQVKIPQFCKRFSPGTSGEIIMLTSSLSPPISTQKANSELP